MAVFAIIHNSWWLLLDKFVRIFLSILVTAWVARYLGPAQYGTLAYIIAYIVFFQAIATLAMHSIIVREISIHPEVSGEILGTAFRLRLFSGVLCWLMSIFIMVIMHGYDDTIVLLTVLIGANLIFQAGDVVDLWFQSQSQNKLTVSAKLISYLLSNAIKVMLILFNANLLAFAMVSTFEIIVATIALCLFYRLYPSKQKMDL